MHLNDAEALTDLQNEPPVSGTTCAQHACKAAHERQEDDLNYRELPMQSSRIQRDQLLQECYANCASIDCQHTSQMLSTSHSQLLKSSRVAMSSSSTISMLGPVLLTALTM